ncbi:MAG: hypothetical protein Q9226_006245, partial [Calogaya cf. arnoldii]
MENQQDIRAMWDTAVATYEKETERELISTNAVRGITTVDDLVDLIEHQSNDFVSFRTRHAKLTSRLQNCLKPVTTLGGIAKGTLANTPYGPASSAIFGAVLHLIQAAQRVTEAFDWVEEALGQLQDFTDRLNLYKQINMDATLEKKVTAILTCLLKVIGRCETLVTRGRFKQYLHVVFLVKDEKTKKMLDESNDPLDKEQRYVVAASYASQKTTEAGVKTLTKNTVETQKGVESTYHLIEDLRAREITKGEDTLVERSLELPAADRTIELYEEFRSKLVKGTGSWLQREPLFTTWTQQKVPILWHLLRLYDKNHIETSGVSIAFFYIRENEQQLREPNTILKTLAWQIAENDPIFKKHAAEVCSSKRNIISVGQTWANLFVAFYQSIANADRSAILVVDGLDEAPRAVRSTLLGLFKGLLSVNAGRITLKGDMDFEREEKFIEVSRDKNQEDLDRYIEDRLSTLSIIKRLGELDKLEARKLMKKQSKPQAPVARRKLKDKILSYADGVFLWAKLLLDQIHEKDYREIEKILSRPPSSLESMVKHVCQHLSAEEEDLELIKCLLTWTAYAQRPLLFGEIELILSSPSRAPNLLLWDKFQGKLASIFELTISEHDSDDNGDDGLIEHGISERNESETMHDEDDELSKTETEDDHNKFVNANQNQGDRFSEDESDEADRQSDTGDFKLLDDLEMDRGLDVLAAGEISSVAGEHLHAYADWQSKTRITYSHLQFREFLVNRKHRDPIDLDIDTERSHLGIALTCFELLQFGFDAHDNSKYLIDYPCRYFVRHLERIDPERLDEEDQYKVIRGICWLFREDRGLRTYSNAPYDSESDMWVDYWTTWLATSTHTRCIRTWLAYGARMSHRFDESALVWMAAASRDTREFVLPWVQTLARVWLTKSGFDDEAYMDKSERLVWLMHGLTSLDENGNIEPTLRDFAFYQLDFTKVSAARLRDLADYAHDDRSPHWHTGLAWVYMEAIYYEEATRHFQAALAIEPGAWLPKEGLARIKGDQENYSEAIQLMEEAYSSIPEKFAYLGGFLLPYVAEWKRLIGDDEGAHETALQGYLAEPSSQLAQDRYLRALDRINDSSTFIQTLKAMHEDTWTDTGISLFDLYAEIGRAYRVEGRPRFVIEAMEQSLRVILVLKDPYMKTCIQGEFGIFQYEYNDDIDAAINLLDEALKTLQGAGPTVQKENKWAHDRYGNLLGRLCFDAAVSARKDGTNTWPYTKRLKQLATVTSTADEDFEDFFDFFGPGYASMLWGCWLRTYERADEGIWRKTFKVRILDELSTLDDEDPSNDMAGLHSLAITLLHLGDDEVAGAILAVLFMPLKVMRDAENDDSNKDAVEEPAQLEAKRDLDENTWEGKSSNDDYLREEIQVEDQINHFSITSSP